MQYDRLKSQEYSCTLLKFWILKLCLDVANNSRCNDGSIHLYLCLISRSLDLLIILLVVRSRPKFSKMK